MICLKFKFRSQRSRSSLSGFLDGILGSCGLFNRVDPQQSKPLTMTLFLLVAMTPFLLENQHLSVLCCADDCGADGCGVNDGAAQCYAAFVLNGENLIELDLFSRHAFDLLDFELVAGLDFVLLSTGLDYGVHSVIPPEQ
jgi:hypothetical protein